MSIQKWGNVVGLAWHLAVNDIRLQYRRSTLGPIWISVTVLAQIAVIGLLFSRLFDSDLGPYLLHLGSGIITWTFIVASINDSAMSLINAGQFIKQVSLPSALHPLREVFRNTILLLHNLVAIVPLVIWVEPNQLYGLALVLPGLLLVVLNISWISTILAMLSARFRDLPAIIVGTLTISFYVTPILWSIDQISENWVRNLLVFNPFYHLVQTFRQPLVGDGWPFQSSLVLALGGAIGWLITIYILRTRGHRVAFWV